MPLLGAHMSIAGGFYKAVERAESVGCDTVQIFTGAPHQWPFLPLANRQNITKNNNQWRAKPLTDEDAACFREALQRCGISHPLAHDSYLINLASPDDVLWHKSIQAFCIELERAARLGIPYVVAHPGSYTTSSEEAGLERIIRGLDEVHSQLPEGQSQCLLECTAGQGSNLGWRLEHLAVILQGVREPERLGICLDTCHLFAAGYPLAPQRMYRSTMDDLQRIIGIERVKAIHLNDSKREFGSRVDRHERIGHGHLGLEPFRLLLNDPRFRNVPMYLETPKGVEDGRELDAINLGTLRGLIDV